MARHVHHPCVNSLCHHTALLSLFDSRNLDPGKVSHLALSWRAKRDSTRFKQKKTKGNPQPKAENHGIMEIRTGLAQCPSPER